MNRRLLPVAVTFALGALAGCAAPKVWVTINPRFDYREISTVAVLPFENRSDDPDAGEVAAEKLAALLADRSAWKVITWRDLGPSSAVDALFTGGRLDTAAALRLAKSAGADTVLTGAVLQYKSDQTHEVRLANDPFPDETTLQGGPAFDDEPVDWYQIDAAAEFSLALLDAAGGQAIWTDARTGTSSDRGEPPRLSEAEVLDKAADAAVRKLLLGLIPHQERVRVQRSSLVTCGEYIDHPMDIRSSFTPRNGALYVVVELDDEFTGKEIVLDLKDIATNSLVAEHRFTWDDTQDTRAFREEIPPIVDKAGYGRYRASYSIDGQAIAHTDFTLSE
jgi:hypothetical protein